jgi:hypothetical protein
VSQVRARVLVVDVEEGYRRDPISRSVESGAASPVSESERPARPPALAGRVNLNRPARLIADLAPDRMEAPSVQLHPDRGASVVAIHVLRGHRLPALPLTGPCLFPGDCLHAWGAVRGLRTTGTTQRAAPLAWLGRVATCRRVGTHGTDDSTRTNVRDVSQTTGGARQGNSLPPCREIPRKQAHGYRGRTHAHPGPGIQGGGT